MIDLVDENLLLSQDTLQVGADTMQFLLHDIDFGYCAWLRGKNGPTTEMRDLFLQGKKRLLKATGDNSRKEQPRDDGDDRKGAEKQRGLFQRAVNHVAREREIDGPACFVRFQDGRVCRRAVPRHRLDPESG